MTTNQCKYLVITVRDSESLLGRLSSLSGWSLQPLGVEGSFEHCLAKGDTRIALALHSESSCMTANVLPYDHKHDVEGANRAIDDLAMALADAGIVFGENVAAIVP